MQAHSVQPTTCLRTSDRLDHLARMDLLPLSSMTSLFVLTLVAPLGQDGRPAPRYDSQVQAARPSLCACSASPTSGGLTGIAQPFFPMQTRSASATWST